MKSILGRGLISAVVILGLISLCACEGDVGQRKPTRTYIPEGYKGWIRIEYRVANMNELPHEWRLTPPMKWNRELVPVSGLLQTSSPYGSGSNSAHDFFFFSDQASRLLPKEMIRCEFTFHNVQFREESANQKEFFMLFIGEPGEESSKHCSEMTRYQTPRFPYFKMNRWSDLPETGNLNLAMSK